MKIEGYTNCFDRIIVTRGFHLIGIKQIPSLTQCVSEKNHENLAKFLRANFWAEFN